MMTGLFRSVIILLPIFLPLITAWKLSRDLKKCNESTVHWFTAKSESASVHFLFAADGHVRPPTLIMVQSALRDSAVSVDCSVYANQSNFRDSVSVYAPTASYGFLFYQLCEYIDSEDKAKIPLNTNCFGYFGSNLNWEYVGSEWTNSDKLTAAFRASISTESHDHFLQGGSIGIEFSVYEADTKPVGSSYYMVPAGLSVEVRLVIDRVKAQYKNTRFAPVFFIFSEQSMEDEDDFVDQSGYSFNTSSGPLGRLESTYILLNKRRKAAEPTPNKPPACIHITPVSVTSSDTIPASRFLRTASVGPRKLIEHKGSAKKFSHSLAYAYYGDKFNQVHQGSHEGYVGGRQQFINLGSPGDGYYAATNYSEWTFILQFGEPVFGDDAVNKGNVAAGVTVVMLFSVIGSAGIAWWYRRRRLRAAELTHRIEPGQQAPVRSDLIESLEPIQRRKFWYPYSRRPLHDDSPSAPLLHTQPPAYDSIDA